MNTRPYHVAIISASRPGLSLQEIASREQRAIHAIEAAGGCHIEAGFGTVDGHVEECLCVTFEDAAKLGIVQDLAANLDQDHMIHIDTRDRAERIRGKDHRAIGTWRECTAAYAAERDHTYLPAEGRYFTITL